MGFVLAGQEYRNSHYLSIVVELDGVGIVALLIFTLYLVIEFSVNVKKDFLLYSLN
jgi:hypothetical protein